MKKLIYLLLSFLFVINVTNAQNVDSFTVSNPNPDFCEAVMLTNLSTNYTSMKWEISSKDFGQYYGYPNDSIAYIVVYDTGCYDVKLIIGRGSKYDTIIKQCAIKSKISKVLKLLGNAVDTVEVNSPYMDSGFTYIGGICFGKIYTDLDGIINTNIVGKYVRKYYAGLVFKNWLDSLERIVYVVDRVAPIINLYKKVDTLEVYHSFKLGYSVTDNYCNSFEMKIHKEGFVDTAKLGIYFLKIWVEDCNGNFSDTQVVTVYVVDATPPVIKWHGNALTYFGICWDCKDTLDFNLWDYAEVTDNYDSNLRVTMSGTYFTNYLINFEEGLYNIIFNAKDFSGNKADSVTIFLLIEYNSIPETQNPIATIFPNPSNGNFMLEITNPEPTDFIRIIDMTGKQILSITSLQQSNEITLPDYCHGIYLLQLVNKEGVLSEKIYIK